MPAKDPAYAREVLDATYGATTLTGAATYYVALYTDVPTADSEGTEVDTAVWTNYARVGVANDGTHWAPAATAGSPSVTSKQNLLDIDWGAATVTGSGGPAITGVAVWDAASGGNRIHYGGLVASVTVLNGVSPKFAAGTLVIQET